MPVEAYKYFSQGLVGSGELVLRFAFPTQRIWPTKLPPPPPRASWLVALVLSALCLTSEAQTLTVTLVPSDYNGYAVSCFGEKDGTLTAVISGGTPPYRLGWSTGEEESLTITDLPSGYYRVKVSDDVGEGVEAEIMLSEPNPLKVDLTPVVYPNEYNISCWECHNGIIYVDTYGGVSPFSAHWDDENTGMMRMGLGAKTHYSAVVTDANGCVAKTQHISLTQPERNDWGMSGNSGTSPGQHYIGTSDGADVVFKSNSQERIRLKSNGDISLFGTLQGTGPLFRNANGTLKLLDLSATPVGPCRLDAGPLWLTGGNPLNTCGGCSGMLGSTDNCPLRFGTNGIEHMRIGTDGKVGVGQGNFPLTDQFEIRTTMERHGLSMVNARSDANAHTEIRFKKNDVERWSLGCDFEGNGGQDLFIWDAAATAKRLEINAQGKVGIGTAPPLNSTSIYKLYVADGIATRDVFVTANEWPDYVFAPGHQLMPLAELRSYLNLNRHLPGIPSAADVEEKGGVELGDLQVRLLQVLEEQALYILQLEERVNALEQGKR
jgi:hypothetical protein